jgi:hypothetical protein
MFERLQIRLAQIERAPEEAKRRAASRVQEKLRSDATTKRGNVPGFAELGGPITAESVPEGVAVRAPGWVHDVAERMDQPAEWGEALADELHREIEGGR